MQLKFWYAKEFFFFPKTAIFRRKPESKNRTDAHQVTDKFRRLCHAPFITMKQCVKLMFLSKIVFLCKFCNRWHTKCVWNWCVNLMSNINCMQVTWPMYHPNRNAIIMSCRLFDKWTLAVSNEFFFFYF